MPEDSSFADPTIISCKLHNLEKEQKPTIRILLYTDDPQEVVRQTGPPLGLGSMINHLASHPLAFANISITLKSRYPELTATPVQKIDALLEQPPQAERFDQVWFFGIHQINKEIFRLGVGGGGPDSELDKNERDKLRGAMDEGLGVLITGDHANKRPADALENPNSPCTDNARPQQFLGLGRALGRCIPRAGQMRDWEGDPTADARHSFNTQVVTFGINVNTESGFQQDATAQQLILRSFNARGKPSRKGLPHPLFLYKGGAIQLFPDHLHEGAAALPKTLDDDWNSTDDVRPNPRVVAYGLDKRNGRRLKLIATYDGDKVGDGRIVADSTWHHYFNLNLTEFQPGSSPFTAADQIGQFYANLALWLTPKHKRKMMFDTMTRWLAQHPLIAEEVGPAPSRHIEDMLNTGSVAFNLLAEVASDCEIHELLQMGVRRSPKKKYESLYFPDRGFTLSPLPSKDLLLGSLIHAAPEEPPESLAAEMFSENRLLSRLNAFENASEVAFRKQRLRIAGTARLAQKLFES